MTTHVSLDEAMAALRAADKAGNVEDARRLAGIVSNLRTPAPAPAPTLAQEAQQTFGFDPDLKRGALLPLARNPAGELEFATPQIGVDLAQSALLPGRAMRGEQYAPEDVARLALDYGMPGIRAPSKAAKGLTKKQFIKGAPTRKELKESSQGIYKRLEEGGATIPGVHIRQVVGNLAAKMKKEIGESQTLYPESRGVMGEWLAKLKPGKDGQYKDLSFVDLEVMRREALKVTKSPKESNAGDMMLEAIDDYIDQLSNMAAGVKKARALWRKNRKVEDIEDIFFNAENVASGFENGIRIGFRQLLKNKRKRANYSDDEINAIQTVVEGAPLTKLTRLLRHLAPAQNRALVPLLAMMGAGGAGATAAGGLGAAAGVAAPAAAGLLAGRHAKKATATAADMVKAMVARGKKFEAANTKLRKGMRRRAAGMGRRAAGPALGTQIDDDDPLRQAILRGDII